MIICYKIIMDRKRVAVAGPSRARFENVRNLYCLSDYFDISQVLEREKSARAKAVINSVERKKRGADLQTALAEAAALREQHERWQAHREEELQNLTILFQNEIVNLEARFKKQIQDKEEREAQQIQQYEEKLQSVDKTNKTLVSVFVHDVFLSLNSYSGGVGGGYEG